MPTAQFVHFLRPKTVTLQLTDSHADDHERRLDEIHQNWVPGLMLRRSTAPGQSTFSKCTIAPHLA